MILTMMCLGNNMTAHYAGPPDESARELIESALQKPAGNKPTEQAVLERINESRSINIALLEHYIKQFYCKTKEDAERAEWAIQNLIEAIEVDG